MEELNLKIEYVPIDSIKPYTGNAKLHPPEQIEQIKESIRRVGFRDPIGVWNGEIVEGHGRHLAAQELGMTEVPIIRLDDLTDEERRAYALIHNQTTMNSGWDISLLDIELGDITDIDMSAFGFGLDEEEKKRPEKPEVEFTEVLGEENNYLVMQFKTDIDWINACSLFEIGQAKALSTRKDGKLTKSMTRIGMARVLDGAKALAKLVGEV